MFYNMQHATDSVWNPVSSFGISSRLRTESPRNRFLISGRESSFISFSRSLNWLWV